MTKIVEVSRGLGLGGAETLLFSRIRHWVETGRVEAGDITVVNAYSALNHYAAPLRRLGVEVLDVDTSSRWLSAIRLWRLAEGFDRHAAVVVHSPWPAAVLKARSRLRRDVRVVEVAHSTRYARPTQWLGQMLNRYAEGCISVSADVNSAPTTIGFRKKQIIHAGADRGAMRAWVQSNPQADRDFRRELGLAEDARVVVAVGNLRAVKGHAVLISAMRDLPSDVHAVIVGEGPERPALEAAARTAGCGTRVHLIGRCEDAWRWSAVADVLVHPSFYEGLPVALVEAHVLGVPVVASRVGGVETVLDGKSMTWIVTPGASDQLASALSQALAAAPAVTQVFSKRAAAATQWDMTRFCDQFLSAIEGQSRA